MTPSPSRKQKREETPQAITELLSDLMPDRRRPRSKPLSWQQAVDLWGSEAALKKELGASWASYKTYNRVPASRAYWLLHDRQKITGTVAAHGARTEPQPFSRNPEWRDTRTYTICIEALERLAEREQWDTIRGVARLLEKLAKWSDEDWEALYRAQVDRLVSRVRTRVAGEARRVPGTRR